MHQQQIEILAQSEDKQSNLRHEAFVQDVLLGLNNCPKTLPSKYIYDDEGSRLFEEIMKLEEYYPTRCEREILEENAPEFAGFTGSSPFNLIELGAGSGEKTVLLLNEMLRQQKQVRYVPVDISEGAIKQLTEKFTKQMPTLPIKGLVAEYSRGIKWVKKNSDSRNFVLFMGSNIGNFRPEERRSFLLSLWNSMRDGDFLAIGFDLKKDIEVLRNAYNDSKGVTAAFNMNLLTRINRELGGNFNTKNFTFYSNYNPLDGAIESFLISLQEQKVYIEELETSFQFKQWEPIHTEYSFKFTFAQIEELAAQTGFKPVKKFTDKRGYFADVVWQVSK